MSYIRIPPQDPQNVFVKGALERGGLVVEQECPVKPFWGSHLLMELQRWFAMTRLSLHGSVPVTSKDIPGEEHKRQIARCLPRSALAQTIYEFVPVPVAGAVNILGDPSILEELWHL